MATRATGWNELLAERKTQVRRVMGAISSRYQEYSGPHNLRLLICHHGVASVLPDRPTTLPDGFA